MNHRVLVLGAIRDSGMGIHELKQNMRNIGISNADTYYAVLELIKMGDVIFKGDVLHVRN